MVLPAFEIHSRPELRLLPHILPEDQFHISAPLSKRAIAYGLDILLIGMISAMVHFAFFALYKNLIPTFGLVPLEGKSPWLIVATKQFLRIVVFTAYFTLSYWYLNGRSLGKLACKIRIIINSELNEEWSLSEAFLRAACYQASYLIFGLGFLLPLWREDKKCLHDLLSKTSVVSDPI